MTKIIQCLMIGILALLCQSCSVNRNNVTWNTYLNRTLQEDKIKPFEKVLIVADLFHIPHADNVFKKNYPILRDKIAEKGVPTQLIIKDYKKTKPNEEVDALIREFQPTHIIYTTHPIVDFEEYVKYDYVDIKVVDTRLSEEVWNGRIVTVSLALSGGFQRGIYKAFESDKFLKTKSE